MKLIAFFFRDVAIFQCVSVTRVTSFTRIRSASNKKNKMYDQIVQYVSILLKCIVSRKCSLRVERTVERVKRTKAFWLSGGRKNYSTRLRLHLKM